MGVVLLNNLQIYLSFFHIFSPYFHTQIKNKRTSIAMVSLFSCFLIFLSVSIQQSLAIWCYRCTSATPGCGDQFNWRGIGYLGERCPEDEDICVKVTERRGAKETIIRDCLSALKFRTDIPADKYEGCRKSAVDLRLGNYVNHTVKEHDVYRNYFPDVQFCFCFLDHRCNGASALNKNTMAIVSLVSFVVIALRKL